MELISPEQYANNNKEKNIEEIINIKEKLEQDITYLESLSKNPKKDYFGFDQTKVQLNVYKKYLLKLEEIIKLKENN